MPLLLLDLGFGLQPQTANPVPVLHHTPAHPHPCTPACPCRCQVSVYNLQAEKRVKTLSIDATLTTATTIKSFSFR